MTIQLRLPPALESQLQAEAAARGKDVETVVIHALFEKFGADAYASADVSRPSAVEFDSTLAELSFNGPALPANFSRVDIYSDQD